MNNLIHKFVIKNKALIFVGFFFLILASCKQSTSSEKQNKPNILFFFVDDLRPQLGCYGNDYMKTPNLDQLASEGTLFKNHYVQVPTCGASRYSILTGMYPKKKSDINNHVIVKEIANKPQQDSPETFIHHLKRNGYYTVGVGKISHSPDGLVYGYEETPSKKLELPQSWDEMVFDAGKWGTGWNAFFGYADGSNRQSKNKSVKPYEKEDVEDDAYPDGLTTNLTIKKLRELQKKEQPFFLGVGYFKPHLPFNAPKKYWDLYDQDEVPLAANPNIPIGSNSLGIHNSNEFNNYKLGEEKAKAGKQLSNAYAQKLRHAYAASVSYIDAQIGKVLTELKALNLENETIVVVWGDHGWHLGDQTIWGKHSPFEKALKSALIIKVPKAKNKSTVNDIVESVDIYATLNELTDVPLPTVTDGNSFAGIFNKNQIIRDSVAFGYWKNCITVRTNRYRLIEFNINGKTDYQLYDYIADPEETVNIAKKNPETVEKLRALLNEKNKGYLTSFKN
jgi:arylsulfatase A-like enzyme